MMKYRVRCLGHNYDTRYTIDNVHTAINAAQMHSLLPCVEVQVTNENEEHIEWQEPSKPKDARRI